MKVLINSLEIGGAERSLEMLSKYLDMDVYTLFDMSKMNIKYRPITKLKSIKGIFWYLYLPYIIFEAKKMFKSGDIIVSHLNQSNIVNYILKRVLNTKSIMVIHHLFLNRRIPFEIDVMRGADMVVFVSKHMEFDGKIRYGIKNTTTIYNPIDVNSILNNSNLDPGIDGEYILNIGRFIDMKNQDFLINVYSKIKQKLDMKLVILGYGEKKEMLKRLAIRLGLKISENPEDNADVYIISTNNVYPYIKSARAYIHPSTMEGMGIAVLEALVFNKPIIISDYKHGSREILEIGFEEKIEYPKYTERGVLMPVTKDVNSLEGQIWIENIPRILEDYKKVDGLRFIKENFDPVKIADKWKNLLITLEHS